MLDLIDYCHHSARLRGRVVTSVRSHGLFALFEDETLELPGIHVNVGGPDAEDEIWLSVERLHETKPPVVGNGILQPWILFMQGPLDEPRLLAAVSGQELVSAGLHETDSLPAMEDKPTIDPQATVTLAEYPFAEQVRFEFKRYIESKWRPWAELEKSRRRTIRIYSQLFTLKRQLEEGIIEVQLELIWGMGLGVWKREGTALDYPLLTQSVELSLNPQTAAMEIRPRDVDVRLEIDWYASVGISGVANVENEAKRFFANATESFSPFDSTTFEPLLRYAAANLDANGVYLPDIDKSANRTTSRMEERLQVTDTWVLFARPRTNSIFLQDLDQLKKQVEATSVLSPAVSAVVTDPEHTNQVVELPVFRGVTTANHTEAEDTVSKARDLFFPKPFNDEQVRIIQLLQVSDGVVVQGPPGTGKTHTIANVICHYLAEGKRVLVTSMKEPALGVLQEQLPAEIRPLAISLLTTERDGIKQFEYAIGRIAAEVQSIDRTATAREINHLVREIDTLHRRLATIDRKIGEWARQNLESIDLDGQKINPQDAAREVVMDTVWTELIPDNIDVGLEYVPQYADEDIVLLREARRVLGLDIDYLGANLPQMEALPDSRELLQAHLDLSQFERLQKQVENGLVPAMADSTQETIAFAQQLYEYIKALRNRRDEVACARQAWIENLRQWLRHNKNIDLLAIMEAIGSEVQQVADNYKAFLIRPVSIPTDLDCNLTLVNAVNNLAEGKHPFGLKGLIGMAEEKKQLKQISILGEPPNATTDWQFIAKLIELNKHLRKIAIRWNALASKMPVPTLPVTTPEAGLSVAEVYALVCRVKELVDIENVIQSLITRVFPSWSHPNEVVDNPDSLDYLDQIIQHHFTKRRLANVGVIKQRCQALLEGRTGRITDEFRRFFNEILGNPEVTDAQMQARWSELTTELSRVIGLDEYLSNVSLLCEKIAASGAPEYAALLKQPMTGPVDRMLPDDLRSIWRRRRLTTYLESIDAREDLKMLVKGRSTIETDIARAYQEIVTKRTWLKLAENASPRIRAALQAYLNAIKRIGKGTGKRALRYRHDARVAASQANSAVPCWIMAHYRVSESLPAELGCFDLLVIDEASQSDLTALPSLLRAQKVLVVGDDKQVSPEGIGMEEEKVRTLMDRFLRSQVDTYRAQMSPDRSIYDLFKVVFAKSAVMLKEHFRCVGPIIEYSKREFYNHELKPLRMPKASQRLDPPLIDVLVKDGYRDGDVNLPEVNFIISEIKAIIEDPKMRGRSIGVISLLADKQPRVIWEQLTEELGPEVMELYKITCGDARTFQGKERDIMFLSMVAAPNNVGAPLSRDTFAQRFNVAASRAKDRMYLVRSVELDDLSSADWLRRSLIRHFSAPFAQDEKRVEDQRRLCESDFERDLYDELTQRGYWVTPQVRVGHYRIDMVVEGHNDARLAIECDGDRYHGPDKWADDMQRQRVLERTGWVFWRCFASTYIRHRTEVLDDLLTTLRERGVEPIGAEGAPQSVHTEHRTYSSQVNQTTEQSETTEHISPNGESVEQGDLYNVHPIKVDRGISVNEISSAQFVGGIEANAIPELRKEPYLLEAETKKLLLVEYVEYSGPPGKDPREVNNREIIDGLLRIIEVEGPVIASRAYGVYLRGCGIKRMGRDLRRILNRALSKAVREGYVICQDEIGKGGIISSTVRMKDCLTVKMRSRGPRSLDEIPKSELLEVARCLAEERKMTYGSEEHLRALMDIYDSKRLTGRVEELFRSVLDAGFSSNGVK